MLSQVCVIIETAEEAHFFVSLNQHCVIQFIYLYFSWNIIIRCLTVKSSWHNSYNYGAIITTPIYTANITYFVKLIFVYNMAIYTITYKFTYVFWNSSFAAYSSNNNIQTRLKTWNTVHHYTCYTSAQIMTSVIQMLARKGCALWKTLCYPNSRITKSFSL